MDKNRFAELLAKRFGRDLDLEEQAELEQFLELEHHAEIYKIIKAKSIDTSAVTKEESLALLELLRNRIAMEDRESTTIFRRIRSGYFFKIAAVLICVFIGLLSYLYLDRANVNADYIVTRVKAGQSKQDFTLPDGSTVVLNAGSELRYPRKFEAGLRELTLSGEAFFDVKKDPKRPFIIHTRDMDVRVLGTAFNVRAYADEAESQTALIRGKVEVLLHNARKEKVLLAPSHKLIVKQMVPSGSMSSGRKNNNLINLKATVSDLEMLDDAVVETSWLHDKLVFKDAPLWSVCQEIERQYGVKITIKNQTIKSLHFSASFDKNSIDEIMAALSSAEEFHYKITNNLIELY